MLRLIWVPKEYKKFSFEEMAKDAKNTLAEVKSLQYKLAHQLADATVFLNDLADISEEEAAENLRVIIPYMQHFLDKNSE
ncbi:MAG TPA: hypothetical protein K8V88_06600 [Companilactobacillus farciminis]|uniref:Uncharacterized protein n=1 Tax=Companilactobacillus farciminis TaxID=1612 RepID=A0A921L9E4_9LACO|nr:hypothetical protein [Companilactobacillus farciminis]